MSLLWFACTVCEECDQVVALLAHCVECDMDYCEPCSVDLHTGQDANHTLVPVNGAADAAQYEGEMQLAMEQAAKEAKMVAEHLHNDVEMELSFENATADQINAVIAERNEHKDRENNRRSNNPFERKSDGMDESD
jgi:hypothetical protein